MGDVHAVSHVRPGLSLVCTNTSHYSDIRSILYDTTRSTFTSIDDNSIKVWKARHASEGLDDSHIRIKHDVSFPPGQKCFISAITANPDHSLFFCACLDNSLKVYTHELALQSSCPWPLRRVSRLIYCPHTHDIITVSATHGVQSWSCTQDSAAKLEDQGKLPWLRRLDTSVPWNYGKYLIISKRLTFTLPGTRPSSAGKQPAGDKSADCSADRHIGELQLYHCARHLYVAIRGSIHCYDTQSGEELSCWHNISHQPLSSFIIVDQHDLLITAASLASHATAWKVHLDTGQVSKLRDCAPSAGMLTSLVASSCQSMMMTCSMDGTLVLWSLQTFDLLFSTRMAQAPRCAALHPGDLISVAVGSQAHVLSVHQPYQLLMECSSDVVRLQPLEPGVFLVEHADNSIRVLDISSHTPDKSLMATVPQLSTHSLLAVAPSLPSGRLYALLGNSQVHVWAAGPRGQGAQLLEVWASLAKERCCSIALLEGSQVPQVVAWRLGLADTPRDGSGIAARSLRSTVESPRCSRATGDLEAARPDSAPTAEGADGAGDTLGSAEGSAEGSADTDDGSGAAPAAGAGGSLPSLPRRSRREGMLNGLNQSFVAGGMPLEQQSGQHVDSHVILGTASGYVLFCDTSRNGLQVLKFAAFKDEPVQSLLLDASALRLATCSSSCVKLWDLARLTCLAEHPLSAPATSMVSMAGQLVLGLSSGCMQGLDMATGQVAHISSSRQQEHAISSLACCSQRLQFVACSSDHCARLYDSRYRLHAVLEHGRPQATCCFLNTEGDLLLATGRRLLVVRAESYLPRKRNAAAEEASDDRSTISSWMAEEAATAAAAASKEASPSKRSSGTHRRSTAESLRSSSASHAGMRRCSTASSCGDEGPPVKATGHVISSGKGTAVDLARSRTRAEQLRRTVPRSRTAPGQPLVPQLHSGLLAAATAALPGQPAAPASHDTSTLLPAISSRSQGRGQGTSRSAKATAAPPATAAVAAAATVAAAAVRTPEPGAMASSSTPVALSMPSRLRRLGLPPPPAWERGQTSSTTTALDPGAARPSSGTKSPLALELQQLLLAKVDSVASSGTRSEAVTARRHVWEVTGAAGVAAAAGMPKALQPLMRRALKVVADPAAFLDGYVPAAAQRRRRVKGTKKLRQAPVPAQSSAGAAAGAAGTAAAGAMPSGAAGPAAGAGASKQAATGKPRSKAPAAMVAKLVRAAKPRRVSSRAPPSTGPRSQPEQLADRCGDMRVKQELRLLAVHELIHQRVKRTVLDARG